MIVLLGIAGAGKSTQAQLLAQKLQCPRISTGDIARTRLKGEQRQKMLAGEVISDSIILPLLEDELRRFDAKNQECILDGFPRTLDQARWLKQKIEDGSIKFSAVIHLKLEVTQASKRLFERGRGDDSDAAIAQRFKEYHDVIMPILDFFQTNNLPIFEVNASQTPEEVAKQVHRALGLNS